MLRINRGAITGEARLLFGVPKSAIVDTLLEASPESRNNAFQLVTGTTDEATNSSLIALTHSDLIRVFQAAGITADEIRRLHDEFRYRGMKSLYLYACDYSTSGISIDITAINNILFNLQSDYQKRSADYSFSRLQFSDDDDSDHSAQPPIEVRYSYVAAVQIVDPQKEYPSLVDDLRRGFIWLQPDEAWMTICARDEAINDWIVSVKSNRIK